MLHPRAPGGRDPGPDDSSEPVVDGRRRGVSRHRPVLCHGGYLSPPPGGECRGGWWPARKRSRLAALGWAQGGCSSVVVTIWAWPVLVARRGAPAVGAVDYRTEWGSLVRAQAATVTVSN